jgi:hypothetical protein
MCVNPVQEGGKRFETGVWWPWLRRIVEEQRTVSRANASQCPEFDVCTVAIGDVGQGGDLEKEATTLRQLEIGIADAGQV